MNEDQKRWKVVNSLNLQIVKFHDEYHRVQRQKVAKSRAKRKR